MAVIQMSGRELTRLRVLIDLSDDRLTVEAAGRLLGLGRRQVYPLRRAFAVEGPTALVSRKCQSALNIDPLSAPKIDPGVGGLCR